MKQPSIHDIETVSPSAKSIVTINTQNNSISLCRKDTSSVEEKEGEKDQYQNDADLSFLDTLDIEELCMKLPSINDDEIVNPSVKPKVTINTQNNSTSWCTKDTFSIQEKEGEKDQNQNNADFSFLDVLDMEDFCVNLPSIDDIENVKPCSEPKDKIITHRRRNVEPSLRILLLKRLASNAKYLNALS
ncbi:hypothetical protein CHS0354_039482 [Potamilus streckersoni]|uniref:Uncharacterized protein n=1 Tax=Potamilus streckersoni TaxID=2493646 RepID=A0AAE0TLN9_9BIVA|nr:hypothetical protein CHS0354_039482 [Potamilus streckersoni]